MEQYYPRITILTPSYNQVKYIEQNILSVRNQGYPNFEHVIIDGGSSDGTIEILKKYSHLKWVSEKDKGQSDALNKGLKIATGEIIGWINSDDYYLPDIFSDVIINFSDLHIQWILGKIKHFYQVLNKFVDKDNPKISYQSLFKPPSMMRQQGAFFRKNILENVGGWDVNFRMCMDWDLWIRLSKISEPKMINKEYAVFRFHPEQKTGIRNFKTQINETFRISKRENRYRMLIYKTIKNLKSLAKHLVKKLLVYLGIIDSSYLWLPMSLKKNSNHLT
jgi:glycosyltransferase involved in cell wall biosynthesis